jgi:hypothetical protein
MVQTERTEIDFRIGLYATMLENLRGLRNFLVYRSQIGESTRKSVLTTKLSARQSRNQRIRSIHHGGHRGHREQKDSFENFSSIYFSLCLFLCVLRALCGASSESFRKPHKFAAIVVRRSTKNSKNLYCYLRALRVLRGGNYPLFFGCGSAALGPLLPPVKK